MNETNAPRFIANIKKSGLISGLILWSIVLISTIFATFNANDPKRVATGVIFAILLLFLIVSHFRQISTANQHLVVDQRGVLYRSWSEKPVPWGDVRSARIHTRHKVTNGEEQKILILKIYPSKNPHRGALLRWLKVPSMAIVTKDMDTSTEQVVAAVRSAHPDIQFF